MTIWLGSAFGHSQRMSARNLLSMSQTGRRTAVAAWKTHSPRKSKLIFKVISEKKNGKWPHATYTEPFFIIFFLFCAGTGAD